eukprot:TRINITY_DN43143_c0_g1_i1.p1 TRINITY_DN43143_c0_g1~~TRINITY_DN43143_c0_g1_i1.p1  ORF type:complete len:650 (+),score=84.90 TRINITY_DN43143_c0_g1_i1:68-2017(+)
MVVYYVPQTGRFRPKWSKTVLPGVVKTPDLWLCVAAHGVLVALVRFGHLEIRNDREIVPFEIVGPILLITILGLMKLVDDTQRRHEVMVRACARVGEETRIFAQDLMATFGRIDEALFLRFVAAKYALASMYVFFFAISGGAVPGRCWAEIRAKGLLDDKEVQFLEGQYNGDRMALLHVWTIWAVNEVAALPTVRTRLGSEALACGMSRLHCGLERIAAAAREVAAHVAVPLPYHHVQFLDMLVLVAMLLMGAVAAPYALTTFYIATGAYLILVVAVLALREVATSLSDPLLKCSPYGFPVAAAVNVTTDSVAQLLIGSSPSVFNPCPSWWDAGRALFSQGQIERRTPQSVFPASGANAYCWKEVKASVAGDQAPPPLIDVGCCHLDADALPPRCESMKRAGHAYQIAKRPRQEGVGVLLSRLQADLDAKGKLPAHLSGVGSSPEDYSTNPSETSWEGALWKRDQSQNVTPALAQEDEWDAVTERTSALPLEHSLASTPAISASKARTTNPETLGQTKQLANIALTRDVEPKEEVVVAGKWAKPADLQRCRGGGASVSPEGLILYTTTVSGLQDSQKRLFGPDGVPIKAATPGMASAVAALAAAQAANGADIKSFGTQFPRDAASEKRSITIPVSPEVLQSLPNVMVRP